MTKEQTLIVGAGITGAVIARILAERNEKILIIDRRHHIGGNIYDYKDDKITVQKYGPHAFHTNNEEVWKFLSKFTTWQPFELRPKVVINGKPVTLPFNLKTISEVFTDDVAADLQEKLVNRYGIDAKIPIFELKKEKDEDLEFLADFVYENVFKNYTIKQWGITPEKINPSVMARVPVIVSYDNRYFHDKYQAIPINGYTSLIQNLLQNDNIEIKLNTDFKFLHQEFKRIIYTGSIDEYFNYKYGELPYRSLYFDIKTVNKEYFQPAAMVNHPNDSEFTRITEHKYFLNEKSDKTIISIEYPQTFKPGENERYYPINNTDNNALYEKYLKEAWSIPNLYFVGRLGEYKYFNMDQAVANALEFCQTIE